MSRHRAEGEPNEARPSPIGRHALSNTPRRHLYGDCPEQVVDRDTKTIDPQRTNCQWCITTWLRS